MQYQVNIDLIRKKRIEKNITLERMAMQLGIDNKASYYRREIGETNFKSAELPIISQILGISLEKIFVRSLRKSKRRATT